MPAGHELSTPPGLPPGRATQHRCEHSGCWHGPGGCCFAHMRRVRPRAPQCDARSRWLGPAPPSVRGHASLGPAPSSAGGGPSHGAAPSGTTPTMSAMYSSRMRPAWRPALTRPHSSALRQSPTQKVVTQQHEGGGTQWAPMHAPDARCHSESTACGRSGGVENTGLPPCCTDGDLATSSLGVSMSHCSLTEKILMFARQHG